jgi:P27 family predicted phage terminase small subunit
MSYREGAPPKPTALKVLAGNPGRRPLNTREPKPELKIPSCPAHLSDEARKEWRRISKLIVKLGLLSVVDRAALAGYCMAWGRWVEAEEQLKKTGTVVKTPNGYPIVSPYLSIANKAVEQMRIFLTEFGLTPASRSRIQALPTEEKSESKLGKYLGKKSA